MYEFSLDRTGHFRVPASVFASHDALVPKLAVHHRDEDTNTVVRLVANIFVVMTSLVFA